MIFLGARQPAMIYCRKMVQAYTLVRMYRKKSQMLQTAPARMRTSLKACKEIASTELEKISCCVGGLHGVLLLGGQNKKIGQRGDTPRGRQHAPTLANQLISAVKGEIKCARVGGGCIAIF